MSLFLLYFYSGLLTLPLINGQYETPNNQCGGRFRSVRGSINFTLNTETNPDPNAKKVCMWTIIPNPFQTHMKFMINSTTNMSCPDTDSLGFTSFAESSAEIQTHSTCSSGEIFILNGSVILVSFISKRPRDGSGFYLTWDQPDPSTFYPRIRFVTAYYSYGKASSRPIPYFAAHFLGNSLSTFAFPMGNRTTGYTLQMTFKEIQLRGNPEDCPMPRPGVGEFPFCNALLICKLNDNGVLSLFQTYNSTSHKNLPAIRNENGIFLIMWGGNKNSARGGGTITFTYTSVRNNRGSKYGNQSG